MAEKKEAGSLHGLKFIVLIEEEYEDLELWVPYYRLKEEGALAITVGNAKGAQHKGRKGYPGTAEAAISDIKSEDFDGVVVPGGYAPDKWRRNPLFAKLVKDVHDQGKLVASICHGPWLLVSAKVLKGRKATSFHSIRDDLENAGAIYQDSEVVVDGSLITSRTPSDLPAFMREIVRFARDYKAKKSKAA